MVISSSVHAEKMSCLHMCAGRETARHPSAERAIGQAKRARSKRSKQQAKQSERTRAEPRRDLHSNAALASLEQLGKTRYSDHDYANRNDLKQTALSRKTWSNAKHISKQYIHKHSYSFRVPILILSSTCNSLW